MVYKPVVKAALNNDFYQPVDDGGGDGDLYVPVDDGGGDGDDEMDLVHWDFLHVTSYHDIQREHREKSHGHPRINKPLP